MSCKHDCEPGPLFPRKIENRPALPEIRYRIGDYGSFREHMLDRLDKSTLLSGWTHRGSDDPGIALMECAATVAEVLTFYQTLYANESLLRTANWRESVSRLVQLSGYRMAPGVAGEASFALTLDGEEPVTVPAGFGFKVDLKGLDESAIFETLAEAQAYPAQNEFHLYRPRRGLQPVSSGLTALELHSVDGANDPESLAAVSFKPGDRILLLPDLAVFAPGGGDYDTSKPQALPEVAIVKSVEQVLDRVTLHFEGALSIARDEIVDAYVIDRSFRHYGHNAPVRIGRLNETTGYMSLEATNFTREIWQNDNGDEGFYSDLPMLELPLDEDVDDIAVGGKLICQGLTEFDDSSGTVPFTVTRTVEALRNDTLTWGGVSGSCAVITMDERMIANLQISREEADIRKLQIHEAVSPALELRAPSAWDDGEFPTTEFDDGDLHGYLVNYYGTRSEAEDLLARELILEGEDGRLQSVNVQAANIFGGTERDPQQPWLWSLLLDQQPVFAREWLDEAEPKVRVYGNVVHTDQGETQAFAPLGSGDGRRKFQTLPLSANPLTYHLLSEATPPQVPSLEVYVDGLRWQREDTLFNAGPLDHVYVVREDEEGNSYIQCGDGITGAVFPSGNNNIEAVLRKGVGARGDADGKVAPTGKLKPLKDAIMIGPAVGGADPEVAASAREAAPQRMQSLGRLVGMADYEAEALSMPGVFKARADWVAPAGGPRIRVAVLTENGDPAEADKVREGLRAANRCRGASRHPVDVVNGRRRFVILTVAAGFDPNYRSDDIHLAVVEALGAWGLAGDSLDINGLFGLGARSFGEGAHVSQVLAATQALAGVTWARVDAFQVLSSGTAEEADPTELGIPASPTRESRVDCNSMELLSLYEDHLVIQLSADSRAEECEG